MASASYKFRCPSTPDSGPQQAGEASARASGIRTARPARVAPAARAAAAAASSQPAPHVCVVGAGVIGLTSALRLLEDGPPGIKVTVVAETVCGATSRAGLLISTGAAGLWKPFTLADTPPESVNRWGGDTFQHYLKLYMSTEAPAAGVQLTSAYQLWREHEPDPSWADLVPHFRHLSPKELAAFDPSASHSHGWFYTTIITEGRLYLAWLLARIEAAGGAVQCRRLGSLDELLLGSGERYDALVNCAGLGGGPLAGDGSVHPVRGQVLRVRAPWVKHYVNADGAYIIPNIDTVVLGGTTQKGDWDLEAREEDRQAILDSCFAVLPSLRVAEVVGDWVGLRPGRPSVRVEAEPDEGRWLVPVVHNYGHGGAGLTLAWGCAGDVVRLLQERLR